MKDFSYIGVPKNFNEFLPELKAKTLKWETVCYSGTQINNSAKISFYSALAEQPHGNIILSPGLATNTDIDPLMKNLLFWALTHKYNVFTFNTFLGDFCKQPSVEQAKRNTYPEFVSLLECCIKFIEPYSINQANVLIGHSAGATGVINALNNMVNQNYKIHLHSVLLFAPCVNQIWDKIFKDLASRRSKSSNFENPDEILPIMNVFDVQDSKTSRYVTITPKFLIDMQEHSIRPDLINKWGTYVTIVAGGKDRKISRQELEKIFQELQNQPNDYRFKFIVLPKAKHSFSDIFADRPAIVNLIKSQQIKIK